LDKVVKEIEDIIEKGLRNDIFRAERAIAINREIAKHSEEINNGNKHKKRLLAYLQNLTVNEAILCTTKLYDPVGKYPTRSIHILLDLLEEKADQLPEIREKHNTIKLLKELNTPHYIIGKVNSEDLSEFPKKFADYFRVLVLDFETEELLNEIKAFRDKRIAHNERVEKDLNVKWESVEKLLNLIKQAVGVIGWAYLNTIYMYENRYHLSSDARRLRGSVKEILDS
jgi:hypothetical protein